MIAASLKNVAPHARGATLGGENILTACGCYNYAKEQRSAAELGIKDSGLPRPKQSDGGGPETL